MGSSRRRLRRVVTRAFFATGAIALLDTVACHGSKIAGVEVGDAASGASSVASPAPSNVSADAAITLADLLAISAQAADGGFADEVVDAGTPKLSDAEAALLVVPRGMFGFAPCSGPAADAYARLHPGDRRKALSERTEPLGAHYTKRLFSVRSGGFEAIAHYDELRCGSIVLSSPVGFLSVSPDENYVVYEDTQGHNLVHSFVSGNIRSATPKPYALPLAVKWDLLRKQVTVRYPSPTKPITVALP